MTQGRFRKDRQVAVPRRPDETRRHTQPAQRQAMRAAFGAAAGLGQETAVQRMVAVAASDMSSVDNSLVLNNLDYALGHFGGPVGDFSAHRKFDATRPGGRVPGG